MADEREEGLTALDRARPYLARLLAAALATLVAWVAARIGIPLLVDDPRLAAAAHTLADVLVTMLFTALATYGASHKAVNSKVNPNDAASFRRSSPDVVAGPRPAVHGPEDRTEGAAGYNLSRPADFVVLTPETTEPNRQEDGRDYATRPADPLPTSRRG